MAKNGQIAKNRALKLAFGGVVFSLLMFGMARISFATEVCQLATTSNPAYSQVYCYNYFRGYSFYWDAPPYKNYYRGTNYPFNATSSMLISIDQTQSCNEIGISATATAETYYLYSSSTSQLMYFGFWCGNHSEDIIPFTSDFSSSTNTRIISLTPLEGSTTTSPVYIDFQFYISPDDTEDGDKVSVWSSNRGMNNLPELFGASNQVILASFLATTSGYYEFSTTTSLANGNYRVGASLRPCINFLGISCLENPLQYLGIYASSALEVTHNYIVGSATSGYSGTPLGNISARINTEINNVLTGGSYSTTTKEALDKCNPLGGTFDIGTCLWVIAIPQIEDLKTILNTSQDIIFHAFPFGYATRFISILASTATTSLPDIDIPIAFPSVGESPLSSTTPYTIHPQEWLDGGNNIATTYRDPVYGKNLRDITEPFIQLQVALSVLLYIIIDLTGYNKKRKHR